MKKLLFILNPCAGKKKANPILPELISLFNRADYEVTTFITAAAGEAHELAKQQADHWDLIVACGGDGTFNEVVSGMLEGGGTTPIGYIPTGSTNDFANSLGLAHDPLEAAANIINGAPQQYDMGSFNQRYFTYVASFGAFTRTSYATSQSIKNALGHTAYLLSGVTDLLQIHKIPVRMELDGQEVLEGDYIFGAICNSTSIGGIVKLDPHVVDLSDGQFEIMLIRAPKNPVELAECIAGIQKQNYEGCRMITFRTAKHLKVTVSPELAWSLDGEMATGDGEISIQNRHLAITLIK